MLGNVIYHVTLESNKIYNEHAAVKDFASKEERCSYRFFDKRERERERETTQILHCRDYKLRYVCLMRSTRGLRPSNFLLPFSHITYSPSAQLPMDTPSNSRHLSHRCRESRKLHLCTCLMCIGGLCKMEVTHYRPNRLVSQ